MQREGLVSSNMEQWNILDVLHSGTLHWIDLHHVNKQAHHRSIQVIRNIEHTSFDLTKQGRHMFIVERQLNNPKGEINIGAQPKTMQLPFRKAEHRG